MSSPNSSQCRCATYHRITSCRFATSVRCRSQESKDLWRSPVLRLGPIGDRRGLPWRKPVYHPADPRSGSQRDGRNGLAACCRRVWSTCSVGVCVKEVHYSARIPRGKKDRWLHIRHSRVRGHWNSSAGISWFSCLIRWCASHSSSDSRPGKCQRSDLEEASYEPARSHAGVLVDHAHYICRCTPMSPA